MMALVEVDGCIFDEQQLGLAHGFESLDPVAREAFVNHLHISGDDRLVIADRIVRFWTVEMQFRWPGRAFRIYMQFEPSEVFIRFHTVRPGLPHWCDSGLDIIEINAMRRRSPRQ